MAESDINIESTNAGKGKSKLLLIIIAVLVMVLAGVGAMLFLGGDDTSSDQAETENTEAAEPVKKKAIYFEVDKPLVVNFDRQSNGEVRYLQLKLKVMARDQAVIDDFQLHLPAIQHNMLLLLHSQKYDELNTSAGKQALRKQTLNAINEILKAEQSAGELESVYLTSLIMQ